MSQLNAAIDAAKVLIGRLADEGHPPSAHSVLVNTIVAEDGSLNHRIVAAVNPNYPATINLPENIDGIDVVAMEWGD